MFWEKKLRLSCIVSVAMCAIGPLAAQGQQSMADMNAPGMFLMGLASGTSANPASYPMLNSLFHNKGGGNFEEVAHSQMLVMRMALSTSAQSPQKMQLARSRLATRR